MRKEAAYKYDGKGEHMPKKEKLIEPIPATMEEVVKSFSANHPKPRDPKKGKQERMESHNLKIKQKSPGK